MSDKGSASDTFSETAVGMMILGAMFLVLAYIVWHFMEYEIKNGIRWLRYAEMSAVSTFVGKNYTIVWDGMEIPYKQTVKNVPNVIADCDTVENPDMLGHCLNDDTMRLISALALEPLRWIIIGILGFMGIWAYKYGPKTYYRRRMALDGLLTHQAKVFPVILPFVHFNPSDQPPRPPGSPVPADLPLFAEALGPEEWIAYNNIPIPDGQIDEIAAHDAFSQQLGPPWRGAARLQDYKQVLLAAFCLKASRKRVDADHILSELSRCWSAKKGFVMNKKLLKGAQAILKNREIAGPTLAVCNQHAYQTTALMRALLYAREEGGVLSPSQFVWLRGHDRALWYPLNNLGRQAFHMEALGAMAHFKAEKLTKRPIPRPKTEEAVQSISEYMVSLRARPIPQLDYSNSRKKSVKQPGKSDAIKKPGQTGAKK